MKIKKNPRSYFIDVEWEIEWSQVLSKLGIRFQKTNRGIGIYVAKCIFHEEKTPSLVFTNKNFYQCFGCGVSGDMTMFISYVLTGRTSGDISRTYRWLKKHFDIPFPRNR
jgi:hypothetical protein